MAVGCFDTPRWRDVVMCLECPIDLRRATAGRRLAAFGWDYIVVIGYSVTLAVVSSIVQIGVFGGFVEPGRGSPWLFDLLAFVVLVLPVVLYFAVSEASSAQATWGKRRVRVRVVGRDGRGLSMGRSLVRSAVKFLPWQIAHTCLFNIPGWPVAPEAPPFWVIGGFALSFALVGAYLIGLFVSPVHQTLYDRIAGSQVVVGVA